MTALTWDDIPDEPIAQDPPRPAKQETLAAPELKPELMAVAPESTRKKGPFDEEIEKRINKISSKEIWEALDRGQDGDAEIFIQLFRDIFLYDRSLDVWLYFNDHYWRQDKKGQVITSVDKIISVYRKEMGRLYTARKAAEKQGRPQEIKKYETRADIIKKRLYKLHSLSYKKNVLVLASSGVDSLATTGDEWDTHPMLLAVRNGCINLETGQFMNGRPEDMIKKACPIKWDDINAVPQAWINFLHGSLNGNQEIIDYIQRLLGYAITGATNENVYPIFWGEYGQNGKGTIIETVREILGRDMAVKLSSEFLIQSKIQRSSGSPDAEMYSLKGARVAWCSETNKNERINTGKIKGLSGGDTITARPPYAKEPISFRPSHLIFILTNMRPQIPADDEATWKRTHLIQFNYSYVENPNPEKPWERKRDSRLSEKLRAEYPAILAWMVRGCLEWQKHGLNPPEKIRTVTEQYQRDEDIFQNFLDDVLVKADPKEQVKRKLFFYTYRDWCVDNGHHSSNITTFYRSLTRKLGKPNNNKAYSGWAIFYDKNA